jgi:uncharacterized damage-inducible protein DinB
MDAAPAAVSRPPSHIEELPGLHDYDFQMKEISVSRPRPDEYAESFAGYVSRAEDIHDARSILAMQQEVVARLLQPLGDESAEYRYAPDKWSIKELFGHICDAERIFAYRLLRVGRGDATPLAGFDENAYVPAARSHRRRLADLIEEWRAVRTATTTLVRGMPEDAWENRGTSNGHVISARALLYIIVGHVDHHLGVLAERYGVGERV